MTQSTRRRRRYRTDPVYRAGRILQVRLRHERDNSSPVYRELVALRKRIWSIRQRIGRFMKLAEKNDKKLLAAIRERERLSELWRARRRE